MADSIAFDIDAAEVLAKMHLAAKGQTKAALGKGGFIVNTGIKDDSTNSPEKPGKTTFDLHNKTNAYQVGCVLDISYSRSYDMAQMFGDLERLRTKDLEKPISDKQASTPNKDIDAIKDRIRAVLGSQIGKSALSSKEEIEAAKEAAKKIEEQHKAEYEENVDKMADIAFNALQDYMKWFVGQDNISGLSKDKMLMMNVSDEAKDSNSKVLVKDFKIQQISEQEKAKKLAEFKSAFDNDPSKPNCFQKICFAVQYTLNI